jgi:hypothetical protein
MKMYKLTWSKESFTGKQYIVAFETEQEVKRAMAEVLHQDGYIISLDVIEDKRPIPIKHGITGCINCNLNRNECMYGSMYEAQGQSCKNRAFAGDQELYEYIDSQY